MKIYVAGPLSSPTTVGYMQNCAKMTSCALALRRLGHDPYVPAFDMLAVLVAAAEGEMLSLEDMYSFNYPWLAVSDAVFMIAHSPGTDREVAYARELGLPVYRDFDEVPQED